MQAAKRANAEKKTTRRDTLSNRSEEIMKETLTNLEVEFHQRVDVPTEGMEEFVREEIPPQPVK